MRLHLCIVQSFPHGVLIKFVDYDLSDLYSLKQLSIQIDLQLLKLAHVPLDQNQVETSLSEVVRVHPTNRGRGTIDHSRVC